MRLLSFSMPSRSCGVTLTNDDVLVDIFTRTASAS